MQKPPRLFWLPEVLLLAAFTKSLAFLPVEALDLPHIDIKIVLFFGLAGTVVGYLLPDLRVGLFRGT